MKDYCDNISLQGNVIQEPIVLDDGSQIVSIEEIGYEVINALTKDKLEKATSIVYCCNYDNNLWNYDLECVVSNQLIKANVVINYGVDYAEQYAFDSPISIVEYNNFLSNIASQNMMNVIFKNRNPEGCLVDYSLIMDSSYMIVDGIQSSSLIVKYDKDVIFKGVAGENLSMTKGPLEDSFSVFLPQYMKDAVLNPEKFLNDCKPSVPPPCRLDNSTVDNVEDEEDIAYLNLEDNSANSDDEYLV